MKWFIFWAVWGLLCVTGAVLSTAPVAVALYGIAAFCSGMNAQRYLIEVLNPAPDPRVTTLDDFRAAFEAFSRTTGYKR